MFEMNKEHMRVKQLLVEEQLKNEIKRGKMLSAAIDTTEDKDEMEENEYDTDLEWKCTNAMVFLCERRSFWWFTFFKLLPEPTANQTWMSKTFFSS